MPKKTGTSQLEWTEACIMVTDLLEWARELPDSATVEAAVWHTRTECDRTTLTAVWEEHTG